MTNLVFPFGRPVLPRKPSADGPRPALILGAFPTAFFVQWKPPAPFRSVQALPVDNEPEPFWRGDNEDDLLETWSAAFAEMGWGKVQLPSKFNGQAGKALDLRYLEPLKLSRDQVWLTDCQNVYRASLNVNRRVLDTYAPFAQQNGLPAARLLNHLTDSQLVKETLETQKERMAAELASAAPELIVTLGTSALAVARQFLEPAGKAEIPKILSTDPEVYGKRIPVKFGGKTAEFLPLAHPGAPKRFQDTHDDWLAVLAR